MAFREVIRLLNDKAPHINLAELEQWLRTAVQDEELATALSAIRRAQSTDREQVPAFRSLSIDGLTQVKRSVAETMHGV
jgi:hypothetical protein